MDIYFKELPVIPVTQAKKIIPFDTTYWTGWPTNETSTFIRPHGGSISQSSSSN